MPFEKLRRAIQPMPPEVLERLTAENLLDAYQARPAYQQNDYLAWIARAIRPETQQKRIEQMLRELAGGCLYMGMKHRSK